jgi:small subunit ribosomal protein S6e
MARLHSLHHKTAPRAFYLRFLAGFQHLWFASALFNRFIVQRLIKPKTGFKFALAQFKLVISDPKGKSISQDLKDKAAQPLLGSRIGGVVDSSVVGIAGGKIKITGGSDKSGTPMRSDVHGGVKKYVLLSTGVGNRSEARVRKLVRGNMVTEEIYQLNCLLVEGALPEKSAEPATEAQPAEPAKKKK